MPSTCMQKNYFYLLMAFGKQAFFKNKPFMLPQQPVEFSNLDKSLMKYGELFNGYFCKNKISNETAESAYFYFSHYKSINI